MHEGAPFHPFRCSHWQFFFWICVYVGSYTGFPSCCPCRCNSTATARADDDLRQLTQHIQAETTGALKLQYHAGMFKQTVEEAYNWYSRTEETRSKGWSDSLPSFHPCFWVIVLAIYFCWTSLISCTTWVNAKTLPQDHRVSCTPNSRTQAWTCRWDHGEKIEEVIERNFSMVVFSLLSWLTNLSNDFIHRNDVYLRWNRHHGVSICIAEAHYWLVDQVLSVEPINTTWLQQFGLLMLEAAVDCNREMSLGASLCWRSSSASQFNVYNDSNFCFCLCRQHQ